MRRLWVVICGLGLLLLSCQASQGSEPTPLPTAVAVATTAPNPQAASRPATALAEVTEVEILSSEEGSGLTLTAVVHGVLPDDCTTIGDVQQQRQGGNFRLEITTNFLVEAECDLAPREFEERIPLDTLGLTPGFYAVSANGVSTPYTFDGPGELAGGLGESSISGEIWHDLCVDTGLVVAEPTAGCRLVDGVGLADGVRQPEEPGLQNVQVGLATGGCAAAEPVVLRQVSDANGRFTFPQLPAGEYCILIGLDPLEDPLNAALLLPGEWSQGSGELTVELGEGELLEGVAFGWDYARLPRVEAGAGCENKAFFVEDVTIPDGTILRPGERFEKVWRLENIGTCTWEGGYTLLPLENSSFQVSGPLGGSAAPTEQIEVRLLLTAPTRPGRYIGRWFLKPPEGEAFAIGINRNNALTVEIIIPAPPATPTPEPTVEE